jgi:Periplasmic binding protein
MGDTPKKRSGLTRYWPILAVVVVVAAALGIGAIVGGGGDDGKDSEEAAAPGDGTPPALAAFPGEDPMDAPDCDRDTGRLAIPTVYAPNCVPIWDADRDNGGATTNGVTEDEITVAYYNPQDDPNVIAIRDSVIADPPTDEELAADRQKEVEAYNHLFETYGRTVKLVQVDASGSASDDAAARSDAIKIADDIGAFAVIGGPAQTNAYAEELSARGVLCLCATGQPQELYESLEPYAWGTTLASTQGYVHRADYVLNRLAGEKAEFAGEPDFQDAERSFAIVYYETADGSRGPGVDFFEQRLKDGGVELADRIPYILDLTQAPEDAATIVARLKDKGITSVIFAGDGFFPIYLTQAATNQDYHPEWIITGSTGTDITALARRYDQEQWSHAFGISYLLARVDPDVIDEQGNLVSWYLGENLDDYPNIFDFGRVFTGIHLAGPELTPETFRDGLFSFDPTGAYTTAFGTSYGNVRWPRVDYSGSDDVTEVYWDAQATGQDETGADGTGMYRYMNEGKRYLPGELADSTAVPFDPDNTFTILDAFPASDMPPTYERRTSRTG